MGRHDGVARRRSCWWAVLAVGVVLLALYGALYVAAMYRQPRLQVCDAKVQGGRMVYDPLTGNTTLQGVRFNLHLCWK